MREGEFPLFLRFRGDSMTMTDFCTLMVSTMKGAFCGLE